MDRGPQKNKQRMQALTLASSALTSVCLQVQWFRLMHIAVSYATGRPPFHHEKETLIKYQGKKMFRPKQVKFCHLDGQVS
jgi:hypothetical protein